MDIIQFPMKHRFSHQREIVYKILKKNEGHLSAEEIHKFVLKEEPRISLGTVYRNLGVLEEMGEIRKLIVEDKVLYEGETEPHHHLICKNCGSVENVYKPAYIKCVSCLSWVKNFHVEEVYINAYGICDKCKK